MIKYNLDKLIKIKVIGHTLNTDWYWQEEKRILGIKTRSEGWVNTWDGVLSLVNIDPRPYDYKFKEYLLVDAKEVFIKPRVVLYFHNDFSQVKYFSEKTEAIEYANDLISKSKAKYIEFK